MYKAILVDDEKIVRLALKTIVDWTALGYTVTGSYSSVKTALLEIEDDPPDLIITDIKMPDMDGLQFIQQVRQQNRECEIIVLTNHENFSYAVEAIRLGVMDYVVKTDISPESLSTLLQKAPAICKLLREQKTARPVQVGPAKTADSLTKCWGLPFECLLLTWHQHNCCLIWTQPNQCGSRSPQLFTQ